MMSNDRYQFERITPEEDKYHICEEHKIVGCAWKEEDEFICSVFFHEITRHESLDAVKKHMKDTYEATGI